MVDVHELRNIAARVAATADLLDVRLFHLESTLENVPSNGSALTYSFDSNVEVQRSGEETAALIVDGSYDVTLTQAEADQAEESESDDERPIAHLKIQLAALYEIADRHSIDFNDEELDAFAKTTGLLALHPYARELVANLTTRMGLPALHVGTVRIPLDKQNRDD